MPEWYNTPLFFNYTSLPSPRYSEYLNSSVLERFFSRGVVLNEQGFGDTGRLYTV